MDRRVSHEKDERQDLRIRLSRGELRYVQHPVWGAFGGATRSAERQTIAQARSAALNTRYCASTSAGEKPRSRAAALDDSWLFGSTRVAASAAPRNDGRHADERERHAQALVARPMPLIESLVVQCRCAR